MNRIMNVLTLFTSFSTLICCALPALLVTIGLGASLAGLLGIFPQLVWVSENKGVVFLSAGVLLALNGFLLWNNRQKPCPDDDKAEACAYTKKVSLWPYYISVAIYLIGFAFAYVLPLL